MTPGEAGRANAVELSVLGQGVSVRGVDILTDKALQFAICGDTVDALGLTLLFI